MNEFIREIRRELSYALSHYKDGHYSTAIAVMLQVRELTDRTLNHIQERSQANGKESRDTTGAETGENKA